MTCAAALWAGAADAALSPTVKCQQAKLKAQARYQACVKNNAANVVGGKDDKSSVCQEKLATALQKADEKATKAGTACRVVGNGDGTLTDLNTGLMWENKDDANGIHDKDDEYTWGSGSVPNGGAFVTFLGTLNGGTASGVNNIVTPCFAGHCDWRLPTLQELMGIVDFNAAGCSDFTAPCIDPAVRARSAERDRPPSIRSGGRRTPGVVTRRLTRPGRCDHASARGRRRSRGVAPHRSARALRPCRRRAKGG